jgi:hypothetical protein
MSACCSHTAAPLVLCATAQPQTRYTAKQHNPAKSGNTTHPEIVGYMTHRVRVVGQGTCV